ncbi:MAG: hypothetical protein K6T35_06120 [Meiothermus silvanus]|nr:hypothetical protein [Allomeiothermus silvanus]
MRRLIPLLALLLLGAACNQKLPPPPPPPVQDPPAAGPLSLELEDFTLLWRNADPNINAQVYVGPAQGGWLEYISTLNLYSISPMYKSPMQLRLRQGRIEVWGQDISYNQVYGGRRFRWVYHFRFDDSGMRPRLVFPDGPVAFEVIDRFPWGDKPPLDPSVLQSLRTTSLVGGMQLCIREEWTPQGWNTPLKKGLLGYSYLLSGSSSVPPGQDNFLVVYQWFDGLFMGRPGIGGSGPLSLGPVGPGMDFNNPTTFDPEPRTHSLVMISKSYGVGQYPQPWEGRWFRTYNRGFGAWPDPNEPGGVRCEFGEGWQVEEVTDPGEIALLEQYESTRFTRDYQDHPPYPLLSALDPRLCPNPWRRGDGTCATQ